MYELNKIQSDVVKELSLHPFRRFSEMMKVTDLTSDDFKFHLRKLLHAGLVMKNKEGLYELTAYGKEFSNRFDYENGTIIKQPKITTATYVKRINPETQKLEYLFYQRLRQPYYHYWGIIGKPVKWGETFEDAASRGLEENAGLTGSVVFKGFYRQRDFLDDSDIILDDKLFVVFEAEWQGQNPISTDLAKAEWMTPDELKSKEKRFESCVEMMVNLDNEIVWVGNDDSRYKPEDF